MKSILRKTLPLSLRLWTTPFRRQMHNFRTLSREYGQFRSMRRWDCRDKNGNEIPWYTYPAIEFLSQFDFSKQLIFEFGSGNSSVWWSEKCERLISVEDNRNWFLRIGEKLNSLENFEYRLCETVQKYVDHPELKGEAGVIIVDGSYRSDCVGQMLTDVGALQKGCGMIILDNADWYPKTVERMQKTFNWVQVDLIGFAPINGYCHSTTIFINPNKTIPRKTSISPLAGVQKISDDDTPVLKHRSTKVLAEPKEALSI